MPYLHGQNQKILLVYDNPEYCELTAKELKSLDFDVHTSKSLQTALMMVNASRKIGASYQWVVVHHTPPDLADTDLIELQAQQRLNDFDLIFFHAATSLADAAKMTHINNHVIPFSEQNGFNAFSAAIKQIIRQKNALKQQQKQTRLWAGKPRVLLVEDNDIGRLMAKALLENLNLEVTGVCNGKDGLNALAHSPFDIVLTDILMPVMNGLDMTRAIRSGGNYELPIIAMSANAETNWSDSFFAGANGFLVKPFDKEALRREVEKWLPFPLPAANTRPAQATVQPDPDLNQLEDLLDIQAGIVRSGGKPDVYRALLSRYHEQFRTFSELIERLLKAHEQQPAVELVHNLRGAAGNIGAVQIELLAGKLEHDLGQPPFDGDIAPLCAEQNRLITALCRFAAADPGAQQLPCGTKDVLISILQALHPLIASHKAGQIKTEEQRLTSYLWPEDMNDEVTELIRRLKGFLYNDALQQITDMLKYADSETEKA